MSIETKVARIKSAKHAGGLVIRLRWISGEREHRVDLAPMVSSVKGLAPIRDERSFAKVAVGEGGHSLTWPGDLDIGADRLWSLDQEQNGLAGVAEFTQWRQRHALSLAAAAQALGVSRRMIAYYAAGTREVPRPILLACKGWEVEQKSAA